MSQVKLTADSGGGSVSLKAPATTTSNASIEITVPDVATGSSVVTTDSNGIAGIGNTSPSSSWSNADDLVIGNGSGHRGLTILAGTGSLSSIEFSDGTGSDAAKTAGGIRYDHSGNYMRFNTNDGSERLRVDETGEILIGTTTAGLGTYGDAITIERAQVGLTLRCTATDQSTHIYFADGTSGTAQHAGYVQYDHSTDRLALGAAAGKRLSVSGDGLLFGTDTAAANALDDYEEGTWTPTLPNGGTITQKAALYTKIGRYVHVYCRAIFAMDDDSDVFRIGGFPYQISGSENYGGGHMTYCHSADVHSLGLLPIVSQVDGGVGYFHRSDGSSSSVKNANLHDIDSTLELIMVWHYMIA